MTISDEIMNHVFEQMDEINKIKDQWIRSCYQKVTGEDLNIDNKESFKDFDMSRTTPFGMLEQTTLRYKGIPVSIFSLSLADGKLKYSIDDIDTSCHNKEGK